MKEAENQILASGEIPDEQYYPLKRVSNSKLKFLTECPNSYRESWRADMKETKAMKFGKMFHCYILEEHEFWNRYFLIDTSQRPEPERTMLAQRNKDWKALLVERAKAAGLIEITEKELDKCIKMKESISREPATWVLTDTPGEVEFGHVWEEEVEYYHPKLHKNQIEFVEMKLKADKIIDVEGSRIIWDLKTVNNLAKWGRHSLEFGYHRQAALYSDTLDAHEYFVIAVETKFPYNVGVWKATPALLELGRNGDPGGPGPSWGYKPLLRMLCQLRALYGTEFDAKSASMSTMGW